jgi:hypothetical protein
VRTKVAETSTGTGENDPITWVCFAILQGSIYGQSLSCPREMEHRRGSYELTAQSKDAAVALSKPSGIGVTQLTNET